MGLWKTSITSLLVLAVYLIWEYKRMSILCSAWLVSTQSVEQTSLAGAIPVVQLLAMVTWGTVSSHGYLGYS